MCENKPGPRCAPDTRDQAQAALSNYTAAHPDGPPVDPLAGVEGQYRGTHRAPSDNGYGRPITRLLETDPDVYDHPDWYGSGEVDPETMRQLNRARQDPDALVTIYRAAPATVTHINDGDWVTLSRAYAEQHAMHSDDPAEDWPIVEAKVPASRVFWDGNDLAEYGYAGTDPVP